MRKRFKTKPAQLAQGKFASFHQLLVATDENQASITYHGRCVIVQQNYPSHTNTRDSSQMISDKLLDADVLSLLIPLVAIIGYFCVRAIDRTFKYRERIAMIEQGIDPDSRRELHETYHTLSDDPDRHRSQ